MTVYQNCKVSDIGPVVVHSGDQGRATATASASSARKNDLSSRCRLRRRETPNRRGPRSRGLSKRRLRSYRRVRPRTGHCGRAKRVSRFLCSS
jgi:hypothetical protein